METEFPRVTFSSLKSLQSLRDNYIAAALAYNVTGSTKLFTKSVTGLVLYELFLCLLSEAEKNSAMLPAITRIKACGDSLTAFVAGTGQSETDRHTFDC